MSKAFYPKLAVTNIKKNGKFYFPYLLTGICTVAMFYIMCAITFNPGMKSMPGSAALITIMYMGSFVVGLFSVIFLFYTNSFLMKRRKKELGLYNILGMEKRHIARIMFFEILFIGLVSIIMGLICGVLFSKLIMMILSKILSFNVPLGFEICKMGILVSVILFSAIFLLTLISNLAKIHLSNPIELLKGGSVGEKEPKTKFILAILGFLCIGTGYTIAIITEYPLKALSRFFIAVILVIIGTYCLFTAGSIAILKILRKNKNYYYKTKHFTAVSGMLYRMKQNAVGLANICILSTMVLVMISTSVSMYIGVDDALTYRFPKDISISSHYVPDDNFNKEEQISKVKDTVKQQGRKMIDMDEYTTIVVGATRSGDKFDVSESIDAYASDINIFVFTTVADYNKMTGKNESLKSNEILFYSEGKDLPNTLSLLDTDYTVKDKVQKFDVTSSYDGFIDNIYYTVVADDNVMSNICNKQLEYNQKSNGMTYQIAFDIDGTDEEKIACSKKLEEVINKPVEGTAVDENANGQIATNSAYIECRQGVRADFYSLYGGLLFLGIFLGVLFMTATVLIIYYKQISEGYDDKERFNVMQKVGMGRSEVKQSIRSQVLTVFFLPLVAAAIHVLASFKMITKLLAIMNLTNIHLFAVCTIITVVIFAIIYAIVYAVTAKAYYKIVNLK